MSERDPLRFVRDDIRALRGYTPGEQRAGCVKLNTNECPWPPAPRVAEAVARAVEGLAVYPDPRATALREAAAERFGARPAQILAGNGSDDCLTIIYRTHLEPGARVVCPDPTYGLYRTLAGIQGAEHVTVPWGPGWALPDLAAARGRVTLVSNPNNPSGTWIELDALRRLADALDGVLVVDEAYIDFTEAERGPSSLIPYLDAHPNLIVLRTFSKSHSLAGARLGLLFAHEALVAEHLKVKDSYNVGALSQAAGLAALADRNDHADRMARVLGERARLEAELAALGWRGPRSFANFLLVHVGPDAERVHRALAAKGILTRWWATPALRDHLRITVGRPEQNDALLTASRSITGSPGPLDGIAPSG